MAKIFVELNADGEVINVSSAKNYPTLLEVELIDASFYFDKIKGYEVRMLKDNAWQMSFNQEKYNSFLNEVNKENAINDAEKLREALATDYILLIASDNDAYVMRYLYNTWMVDAIYNVGDRVLYKDVLYKCKQKHSSQLDYTPDISQSLWDIINGDETKGTLENPIIIPYTFSSMVYTKGKYYKENDDVYLMNREGMNDNEEISLVHKPSELIDIYFTLIAEENTDLSTETEILEFKQPTGAHDAYKKGDKVSFNGKKYESLIDNNVYSPEAYLDGWKEI